MTPEHKSVFHDTGLLVLKGAIGATQVRSLRDHVLAELKRLKVWSSGKTLSASVKAMPAFAQIAKLSGLIKHDSLHHKVLNETTVSAIASLAGSTLLPAQCQFLISLPNQGRWTLDGLSWHTDISSSAQHGIPGIQVFVLIDDVQPHGGATLAIAGSHRLAGREESGRKVRELLRKGDDLEDGLRRHNLSIVEMSGAAGDVYLMDMRLLHTPSINASNKVRIMATVRCLPAVRGAARRGASNR